MSRQRHNENWVKDKIKSILSDLGIWYFMPVGGYYGKSGIPDFVCCCFGRFVGIEAKRSTGKWTLLQQKIARQIANSNGLYIVVDEFGIDDLVAMLCKDKLGAGVVSLFSGSVDE
jgi:hypothetical protein